MSIESFWLTAATLGGGFFVGVLIGYAIKKVIKIVAVIVGLFLAGLAYLQHQHIANINTTPSNALTQISYISGTSIESSHTAASSLAMTSFGIPLTDSSMSAGFTIGFMKG